MDNSLGLVILIILLIRIAIIVACVRKAKKLGRSQLTWGLLGLFIPLIAIIVIQFMKPVNGQKMNSNEILDTP